MTVFVQIDFHLTQTEFPLFRNNLTENRSFNFIRGFHAQKLSTSSFGLSSLRYTDTKALNTKAHNN